MKVQVTLHGHTFSVEGDDVEFSEPLHSMFRTFVNAIGLPTDAAELDGLKRRIQKSNDALQEGVNDGLDGTAGTSGTPGAGDAGGGHPHSGSGRPD